jgi:hypothetical protein
MVFKYIVASLMLACASGFAHAASVTVVDGGDRSGITEPGRNDVNNINIGGADGDFYELGLGGIVEIDFGSFSTGAINVVEVTFGNRDNWEEQFEIQWSLSGSVFQSLGVFLNTAANSAGNIAVSTSVVFDVLRIIDRTAEISDRLGGADIDSINVAPARLSQVPLPAAAWLFLSVLGAGGLLRGAKRQR